MDKQAKQEFETRIVREMIALYCKKKHNKTNTLCCDCQELLDYANARIQRCPFIETKTFCSNCKVHCYKPEMRARIREVMRTSGPWMLLYHPILALKHLYYQVFYS